MKVSFINIGSKLMFIMGIYLFVLSILWVFLTEIMFVSDILAFTGQSWSELLASSPKTAELYMLTKKLLGFELLLISLLIIFITQKSYSKGEKWSWYALFIAGIFTWGSLIGYRFIIGYWASTSSLTFIVGAILFVLGMVIPARAIFKEKST